MDDRGIASGDLTRMAVLALLGRSGPTSRADIARDLELSQATVSQVTKRLIGQGVLEPLDFQPSDGGRPAQLLGLVGTAGYAVGVKVAVDHLAMVGVRLDGQVVAARNEPFDVFAPDALGHLGASLRTFIDEGGSPLLGVGVAVPGVVKRPDLGSVDAAVLGWVDMQVGRQLRKTYLNLSEQKVTIQMTVIRNALSHLAEAVAERVRERMPISEEEEAERMKAYGEHLRAIHANREYQIPVSPFVDNEPEAGA